MYKRQVFNLGPKLYEVEIICDHPAEIERFIIDEIHKSATIDQVIGGYSKEPKTQLDCVCNSREYVPLREFMRDQGFDCFIKVYPCLLYTSLDGLGESQRDRPGQRGGRHRPHRL